MSADIKKVKAELKAIPRKSRKNLFRYYREIMRRSEELATNSDGLWYDRMPKEK